MRKKTRMAQIRIRMTSRLLMLMQFTAAMAVIGFFSTCIFSSQAFAQNRTEFFMSTGYAGVTKSATEFDVAPGFQFTPFPSLFWMQFGGEVTLQKITYQDSSSNSGIFLLGPTANIGPYLADSFFISLGLAYRTGSSAASDGSEVDPNGFGFYFFAGKRFPIGSSFAYRPSLGVVSCGTTGMVFRPLALSYTF